MGGGASTQAPQLEAAAKLSSKEVAARVAAAGPAFAQYERAIIDNGIDGSLIAALSPEDLEQLFAGIGVSKAHLIVLTHNVTRLLSDAAGGARAAPAAAPARGGARAAGAGAAAATAVFDAELTLTVVRGLGRFASALPCVGILGEALGDLCGAVRDAQVNKVAVQSMGRRIHEIALMLDELLPTAERTGVKTRSLEAEVLRLADLVRSAHKFCVEYGKRGFISRVARGFWDERTVRQLDTDLSSCVQDIAVTLSAAQLQFQQTNFEQVGRLERAVLGGESAQIAALSGLSADEAKQELAAVAADVRITKNVALDVHRRQDMLKENQDMLRAGQDEIRALLPHTLSSDGNIARREFLTLFEATFLGGKDLTPATSERFFVKFDLDHDGGISQAEFLKFYAAWKASGLATMEAFVDAYVAAESGTVELRVRVPPGVAPGGVFYAPFEGSSVAVRRPATPAGAEHGGRRVRVTRPGDVAPGSALDVDLSTIVGVDSTGDGAIDAVEPVPGGVPLNGQSEKAYDLTGDRAPNVVARDTTGDGLADSVTLSGRHLTTVPHGVFSVDLTGNGVPNVVGRDLDGDGVVDDVRRIPEMHVHPRVRRHRPLRRRRPDVLGIDTTGDGVVDKVVANRDQTQSATSVKLVCPPNAAPGDTLVFLHPVTNNPITAVVPPGTRPGAPFAVRFPLSLA
ncbi:hypothetical protein JL720_1542 [Aureococcus anophagefferens]|nr:hypothetical protein JL720_1542 [Aureococcus anophagefferens]